MKKGDSAKAAVRDGSGDKSAPAPVLQGSAVSSEVSEIYKPPRTHTYALPRRDLAVDRNYEFHLIFPALPASPLRAHAVTPVYTYISFLSSSSSSSLSVSRRAVLAE